MGVPVLFFCRVLGALVLFLLFPEVLLALFVASITVHDLVDRLTVGAGFDPLLTGLLMLAAALFEHGFLLADSFAQAMEENPEILDPGGVQPAATGLFEIP